MQRMNLDVALVFRFFVARCTVWRYLRASTTAIGGSLTREARCVAGLHVVHAMVARDISRDIRHNFGGARRSAGRWRLILSLWSCICMSEGIVSRSKSFIDSYAARKNRTSS